MTHDFCLLVVVGAAALPNPGKTSQNTRSENSLGTCSAVLESYLMLMSTNYKAKIDERQGGGVFVIDLISPLPVLSMDATI